jgi:hypothetical protein
METEATSEDIHGESPRSLGVSAVGPLKKREGHGKGFQGKAQGLVGPLVERG